MYLDRTFGLRFLLNTERKLRT